MELVKHLMGLGEKQADIEQALKNLKNSPLQMVQAIIDNVEGTNSAQNAWWYAPLTARKGLGGRLSMRSPVRFATRRAIS